MRYTSSVPLLALAALEVAGSPVEVARQAEPTLYLAGDSTMAKSGANDGATDGKYTHNIPYLGWGEYIGQYVTIPVVNKAIGGRSARSYSNEGRFSEIADLVQSGDVVVIEFGHNDGGSPNGADDNGRSDCPGTGDEECTSGKTGETVYTFNRYVEDAARAYLDKGASVVVSSQTPNNLWETGTFQPAAPRFVGYAAVAGENLASDSAAFLDHFQAVANAYQAAGADAVNAFYPNDHTHTSPEGADLVAQAFAQAVSLDFNGTTALKDYLKPDNPTVF